MPMKSAEPCTNAIWSGVNSGSLSFTIFCIITGYPLIKGSRYLQLEADYFLCDFLNGLCLFFGILSLIVGLTDGGTVDLGAN